MAKLSITTAWNETASFVKQEAGPLFLIAFGLMVLPVTILQVLFIQAAPSMLNMASPGALRVGAISPAMGLLAVLLIVAAIVISIWGSLTISMLALGREAVIGSAFRRAAGRILPVIGASLLVGVGAFILVLPFVAVIELLFPGGGTPGVGPRLLILCLVLAMIFFAIRLIISTQVAAAEPVGPIGIIRRSWQLTSDHFWKLLGTVALIFIVYFVVLIVVSALGGLLIGVILGPPAPGGFGSVLIMLLGGLVQAAFGVYFATMMARIYVQLAGELASTAEVFQ